MVVVNDPAVRPTKFLQVHIKNKSDILIKLLDSFTQEGKNIGVKRNNYYILDINRIFAIPVSFITKEYKILMLLIKHASRSLYTYLMITYE